MLCAQAAEKGEACTTGILPLAHQPIQASCLWGGTSHTQADLPRSPGNPSHVHSCSPDSLRLITLILTGQHLTETANTARLCSWHPRPTCWSPPAPSPRVGTPCPSHCGSSVLTISSVPAASGANHSRHRRSSVLPWA